MNKCFSAKRGEGGRGGNVEGKDRRRFSIREKLNNRRNIFAILLYNIYIMIRVCTRMRADARKFVMRSKNDIIDYFKRSSIDLRLFAEVSFYFL